MAACAVALILRLFHLGHQSLWVDEFLTWHTAAVGAPLAWQDVVRNDHGPLVQVLLHWWVRWAGDSEWALRLPSALASAATVPVFAALAACLLGPAALLPAAWAAALSPFLVWYGQEARNYAFAILFSTAAAWAAVRWHQTGRPRYGVAFVTAALAGVLSNLNACLVLPPLVAYVALPHGGRPARPWVAGVALAVLLLFLSPWLVQYASQLAWHRLIPGREALPAETPLRAGTTFSPGAYPFTLSVFSLGYTLGPTLSELHGKTPWRAALAYWPTLSLGVLVFGWLAVRGLGRMARDPDRLALALALLLVPVACVTYFALQNFKVFNPRYVASGLAGYYLILVAGWLTLGRRARLYAGAGILALWGFSLANLYFDPSYGKEDYRAAARWVAQNIHPEDDLIGAGSSGMLDYYWRDRQPGYRHYWLGFAATPARMRERFLEVKHPDRVGYVIVSRPYALDPEGRFDGYLRSEWQASVVAFPGVTVYRLPRRQAVAERVSSKVAASRRQPSR